MEKQQKTIQFFRTEAIMERLEKGESTGTIIEFFEKEWGLSVPYSKKKIKYSIFRRNPKESETFC